MTAPLKLTTHRDLEAAREAATIWGLAKAHRDQNFEPDPVEKTLPGIQRRLDIAGAELILAARSDNYVGFTLFAPRGESLEIFYLAVAPDSWGGGVAKALLASVEGYARDMSRATLDLWVISDNERAINVYKRAGYTDSGQLQHDDSSDRTERRMVKDLG
ncbi:GNAT family N-acetyltransferase [Arthrobacter sp. TWP1-1]|uniref:GNAT family N-acetyltransferase n=1 Tax=Arthrobacter sp. TWP1-1 TaxID=2804568 RepID=UPI003CF94706